MANLSRAKKIPKLQTLLRGHDRASRPPGPQPPAIIRESVLGWASRLGLKVERHDRPVI